MTRVPKELIKHCLKVNPKATPKKQRLCWFSPDKREAAGFIKEVYHLEWLANPVLVLKKNDNEWRMCVDYTDLNRHSPKDPFALPLIDQVIDSMAGCVLLSSLIVTRATIRLASRKKTRSRQCSSPLLDYTPTRLCPSV
jgi:hypothetical protein